MIATCPVLRWPACSSRNHLTHTPRSKSVTPPKWSKTKSILSGSGDAAKDTSTNKPIGNGRKKALPNCLLLGWVKLIQFDSNKPPGRAVWAERAVTPGFLCVCVCVCVSGPVIDWGADCYSTHLSSASLSQSFFCLVLYLLSPLITFLCGQCVARQEDVTSRDFRAGWPFILAPVGRCTDLSPNGLRVALFLFSDCPIVILILPSTHTHTHTMPSSR